MVSGAFSVSVEPNDVKCILSSQDSHGVLMEVRGVGNRYGINDDEVHQMMLSYGFTTFQYNPYKRTIESLDKQINKKRKHLVYKRKVSKHGYRESNIRSAFLG